MFGEVWGVGPATALKLYDKGHRTLEDLKNDPSLTNAQKLGLQYFDDIKTRIPRHEVSSCAFLFLINRSNPLILLLEFSLNHVSFKLTGRRNGEIAAEGWRRSSARSKN